MSKLHVEESIQIAAPRQTVFDYLRDFHNWPQWSPWLITDPECLVTYPGDSYTWDGPVSGAGEMAAVQDNPPEQMDCALTFLKPWKSTADVTLKLQEKDGGTEVTWIMDSGWPFFLFFLKSMMATMIAMDFQRGLKMLKDQMETGSIPSRLEFPGKQDFQGFDYVGIRSECAMDYLGTSMEQSFGMLKEWIETSGVQPAAPPVSIYHKWDLGKGRTLYTAAIPLKTVPAELPDGFITGSMPDCRTFAIKHIGAYRHLGNAWTAGIMRGRSKTFAQNKSIHPFERYMTMPGQLPEEQIVTEVHFPIKG